MWENRTMRGERSALGGSEPNSCLRVIQVLDEYHSKWLFGEIWKSIKSCFGESLFTLLLMLQKCY